ncbi:MAG TPA: tetratricopeptide repeat protein [Thermoanaerobaculia bacterium]|nr:tetratricopeptide repeat protein [Thermoanaerobaculia bacterium]
MRGPKSSTPTSRGSESLLLLLLLLLAGNLVIAGASWGQDESAAQRLMQEAERQLASGNLVGAIAEYEALVTRFPDSRTAPRALQRWANAQYAAGDPDGAYDLADRLVSQYPASPQAAGAMILQARIQLVNANDRSAIEQAATLLRRVPNLFGPESYPSLEARTEARVLTGQISMQLGDLADAAYEFLQTIEVETDSPWSSTARVGLARVLLHAENRSETDLASAIQLLQEAVDAARSDPALIPAVTADAAAEARTLLTTVHRLLIRPVSGGSPWRQAGLLPGVRGKKPQAVATADDGRIAVIDDGTLIIQSPDGAIQTLGGLRNPGRPWFGADGQLYVPLQDSVRQIPGNAGRSFYYDGAKPKDLDKLVAGAQGQLGEWWLYDRSIDGVVVFDRLARKTLGTVPSGGINVADLAAGPLGRVVVLSAKDSRVLVIGPERTTLGGFTGSWRRADAIATDQLGNVYVLDRGSNQIDVRTMGGTKIATLGPLLPGGLELKSPEDLAVDAFGRVLIIDSKLEGPVVVE